MGAELTTVINQLSTTLNQYDTNKTSGNNRVLYFDSKDQLQEREKVAFCFGSIIKYISRFFYDLCAGNSFRTETVVKLLQEKVQLIVTRTELSEKSLGELKTAAEGLKTLKTSLNKNTGEYKAQITLLETAIQSIKDAKVSERFVQKPKKNTTSNNNHDSHKNDNDMELHTFPTTPTPPLPSTTPTPTTITTTTNPTLLNIRENVGNQNKMASKLGDIVSGINMNQETHVITTPTPQPPVVTDEQIKKFVDKYKETYFLRYRKHSPDPYSPPYTVLNDRTSVQITFKTSMEQGRITKLVPLEMVGQVSQLPQEQQNLLIKHLTITTDQSEFNAVFEKVTGKKREVN